jgi:hypothetical protein
MLSGEYYEGDQIAEGVEFVMEHPTEPSWSFYKFTNAAWETRGLACFVNIDVEHARKNYER